ncbi:MAG TPA: hypothetical protein VNU26_16640 [Mycobacteriales bacterium]|nr:hypothetical protein [Mycobacteriales bacterium]
MTDDAERQFHRAMVEVYESAKRETGYNATRFLQMVSEQGGVATARQLLHAPHVSDGFTALWERGRLDLAVEAVMLRDEFEDLFTDEEFDIARQRLTDYGFGVTR